MSTTKRARFIGSSDAPLIVLGEVHGRGRVDVYEEKIGQAFRRPANTLMEWGLLLEPLVVREYTRRTGNPVTRRKRWRMHPTIPYIGAHIDADAGRIGVEAKTSPYAVGWGDPEDGPDGVPEDVRVQVYHQMMCVPEWEAVDVPALVRGHDFRLFRVPRDDAFIADLEAEEVEFWQRHVLPRVPPPPDDTEAYADYLRRRYPADRGTEIVATPEQAVLIDALRRAVLDLAAAESAAEGAKSAVKDAMGVAAVLIGGGARITWRAHDVTTTGWKELAAGYERLVGEVGAWLDEQYRENRIDADMPERIAAQMRLARSGGLPSLYERTRVDRPFRPTFDD